MGLFRFFTIAPAGSFVRIMSSTAPYSSVSALPGHVRQYVEEKAAICKPDDIHVCDGSERENQDLIKTLLDNGQIKALPKYKNCWLVRTDPADVARVESRTYISTPEERDTIPIPKAGVKGLLGNWMSPEETDNALNERFPGSMKGRTMYVIPFSMGPVGGPISKLGVELTDSPYVVASMRIMARIGETALKALESEKNFVKCLHSVGCPLPTDRTMVNNWPCNPEKTLIMHIPANNEIASYGSGYGGNSLLGKKCFALRLGSILARREGWLAEHMLILGITNPKGEKRYLAAAFPSACGKTNLAMMQPALPGYKVECIGDDIAWMKFDKDGRLRAINPEAGFFGVAPGTSSSTNPHAMSTITSNTVFTNVAETADGGFYWEGLEKEIDPYTNNIKTWLNKIHDPDSGPAAHPNSRFCTPAGQCPIMDPLWESPEGVPIDAILFGGRRPEGVPLVYESFSWQHGVFLGAAMRSEATAAAEHKKKEIMHDPFAMRPFFGYNFGHYLSHWLSFEKKPNLHLPRIFHVNWFRKDAKKGGFIWPGFGENARVLDWIFRRVEGEDCAVPSPIGYLPQDGSLNMQGLDTNKIDMNQLFSLPKEFWLKECEEIGRYFDQQVNSDLPKEISDELAALKDRIRKM